MAKPELKTLSEIDKKEPHGKWLARSQIIERLGTLEEKVEIWKNIEDFYKVERIVIIESRLTILEQDLALANEHISNTNITIQKMLPILENITKLLEPEIIVEDLPSEAFVPPLPEIELLPVAEPEINLRESLEEKDMTIVISPGEKINIDLSHIEANPFPAGEFTVGIDPGAPDFVPPEPESRYTEAEILEQKIAAIKAELGEDI